MTDKEAPLDERAKFEAWARDAFVCSEHSFAQAHPYGYFNSVSSQTFGGRVQPRYAEVQMLWDTWRGARETALASPSLPLPSDLSDEQIICIRQRTKGNGSNWSDTIAFARAILAASADLDRGLLEQVLAALECTEIWTKDTEGHSRVMRAIAAIRSRLPSIPGEPKP